MDALVRTIDEFSAFSAGRSRTSFSGSTIPPRPFRRGALNLFGPGQLIIDLGISCSRNCPRAGLNGARAPQ